MSVLIYPPQKAMAIKLTSPFSGVGGTPPYSYKMIPGGAGGIVDPATGVYTSPITTGSDRIQVTDSVGATAISSVMVGAPLDLFCDVIQTELGLAPGRVYVWDQKINEPTDFGLFVVVRELNPKTFGNTNKLDADGNAVQSANVHSQLQIDFKSRGPEARDRKIEFVMALNSYYSESQQELNSFRIFGLPQSHLDFSEVDGMAIPYHYIITCNIQYFVTKIKAIPYYDTFSKVNLVTEP